MARPVTTITTSARTSTAVSNGQTGSVIVSTPGPAGPKGDRGDPGVVQSATAPTDHTVLWADISGL